MLVFDRHVGGLFRYQRVLFPAHAAVRQLGLSLGWNEVVRVLVSQPLIGIPGVVESHEELTTCVCLSAGTEAVWKGMKKASCSYMIRRAERMLDDVEVELNSPRAMRDFLPLFNGFAKSKGPVPLLSHRRFREHLTHGDAFVLYLKGRPMCCHLLVRDPETKTVMLSSSGSRRFETPDDASACGSLNRYLHWYEMQHYYRQGIVTYDFGGIRYPEHPTARFKLSFGGPISTHYYYLLAGSPWIAQLAYALRRRIRKSALPGAGMNAAMVTRQAQELSQSEASQ